MILQKATIVEWRAVFRKENRSCKSKLVLFLCQPDSYKLWVSSDVLLWASSLFAIATSVIKSWKLIVIRAKVVGQLQVARDGRRANAGQIILGRWGGARGICLIDHQRAGAQAGGGGECWFRKKLNGPGWPSGRQGGGKDGIWQHWFGTSYIQPSVQCLLRLQTLIKANEWEHSQKTLFPGCKCWGGKATVEQPHRVPSLLHRYVGLI